MDAQVQSVGAEVEINPDIFLKTTPSHKWINLPKSAQLDRYIKHTIIYVHEIPYDTCMYHVTPNKGQFILMMKTLKILSSFFTKKYMLYSINCHSPVE